MNQTIIVFDLEIVQVTESIEFGAWKIQEGAAESFFHFTIDDNQIPEYTQTLKELVNSAVLLGYNISSKLLLLESKLNFPIKNQILDLKELILIFFPFFGNFKLSYLAKKLNICSEATMSLKSRTWLIWQIYKKCWEKGLSFDLSFFAKAEPFLEGMNCSCFFDSLKREIIKTFPDRPISTEPIFNYFKDNEFLPPENDRPSGNFIPAQEWIAGCFQPGGLLSKNLTGFESRKEQVEMVKAVVECFVNGKSLVIEAGTGTGKSIAYLIPALWWSKKNKGKVVVSTHTITLQEQLYYKDLPFLQNVLPFKFKTAILKGKNNYVCLKRFENEKTAVQKSSSGAKLAFLSMLVWLRETKTGELSELPQFKGIVDISKHFSAENVACEPNRCPFAGKCFMLKARKKAEEADLIVINHSLLFSDIKTENKVLPEYNALIIDEAHHIYQTALKQLGFEISLERISYFIEGIYLSGKSCLYSKLRGILLSIGQNDPEINLKVVIQYVDEIPSNCSLIIETSKELFKLFKIMLAESSNLLLKRENIQDDFFNSFLLEVENLINRFVNLNSVLEKIKKLRIIDNLQPDSLKYDIIKYIGEIECILDGLNGIKDCIDNDLWVTYVEKSGRISLKHCPLEIASIVNDKIFSRNNWTILTSATLCVANSFEYFLKDIGLTKEVQTVQLKSPFDYDKQMLFCVVDDLPLNCLPEDSLAQNVSNFITDVAQLMKGRTLVLFTSNRFLEKVYYSLRLNLKESGLELLAQGIEGSRDKLLEEFINNSQSVLLGTNSFWEGIDIPGNNLRCVIMVKLPFWPPNLPVIEARSRLFRNQGLNPFEELLLPEAVLRFKQGFGRLIRTKEDKGVVILLDERIIKKRYGKKFLYSLPISRFFSGNREDVLKEIKDWV